MDIIEYLFWIGTATMLYTILSTIYRTNAAYDIAEGLGIGAGVGVTFWTNYQTVYTQLYMPITTNLFANWWLFFAVAMGVLHFCLYVRRLIEVFRFVAIASLSISIATVVRTNSAAIWQQIYVSAQLKDFSYIFIWIFFLFGMLYFIYSRKLERPLAVPREIGRWVMVFSLGALLTPMYLRYVEAMIGWTYRINVSPAWWVPYVVFAVIVVDALNRKYKFLTGRTEVIAKA